MLCEITRSSRWGKKPCDEACKRPVTYLDYRTVRTLKAGARQEWYKEWYSRGTNHREENGMIVCEVPAKAWVAEVDDVAEWFRKYGNLRIIASGYKECELSIEIDDV